MLTVPALVGVSSHEVAGSVIVQPSPPRVTETVPVGMPTPGGRAASAIVTVSGESAGEGSGPWPVIVRSTSARVTSCVRVPVLPLFAGSPP